MSMGFVSGDKIDSIASKDVGFFGIFSGEQKNRIDLGGAEDKTHRLAIAYFDKIDPDLEFKKWVWLSLPNGVKVKAEIASIAARLNISSRRIIKLARQDGLKHTCELEKAIEKEVKDYKNDLRIVKGFYQVVSNFLSSSELNVKTLESFVLQIKDLDFSKINNKDIRNVCIKRKQGFVKTLNNLNVKNFKIRTLVHKEALIDTLPSNIVKQNIARAKDKIEKRLKEFDFELFHIDRNFSIKISAPENVIRTLWDSSHNLVHDVAQKIGKATGRRGIRLQLFNDDLKNRFAILTDGNIYHQKPLASKEYVPYSKDKKTWLLLSVKSLASRLHLNPDDIRSSVDKNTFNKLIDNQMKVIEGFRTRFDSLMFNISLKFKDVVALEKYKSESEWTDLFKFIKNKKDLIHIELTKSVNSIFKIFQESTDMSQIEKKLKAELEKKFWWNPLEDEIAFSDF